MALQIIPFQAGINTCYILKDRGAVLVDAGYPGCSKSFSELLDKHQIRADEIQLIIPTHGDFDHAGGAKELKELTGAKIVLHRNDKDLLEKGIFHWPRGVTNWGKFSRALLKPLLMSRVTCPATAVDLVLDDKGLPLKEYGPAEGELGESHQQGGPNHLARPRQILSTG